MINTIIHFKQDGSESETINFLILPKLGETISYGPKGNKSYYVIERIVHNVDYKSKKSSQQLDIYVQEE